MTFGLAIASHVVTALHGITVKDLFSATRVTTSSAAV